MDFYQEFIDRHAPISKSWFQTAARGHREDSLHHEATGAGILYSDDGVADKLIAPLDDGSICLWDAAGSRQGRIVARTAVGVLAGKGSDLDLTTRLAQSQAMMTETGAVEVVSVDSRAQKAFFAVQSSLNEVDLRTLQVVSRTPYPFAITALSEARHPTPLTVGTNWTVHLHDTRLPSSSRVELIGGANDASTSFSRSDLGAHVSLAQPGALSILHLPSSREPDVNGDIWLAGRFTSILNFDRRFFPRLRGAVHSGARLSCLSTIPYPFVPHAASLEARTAAKRASGHMIIAAGEYKGKGSLELYGVSSESARGIDSRDARTTRKPGVCYLNRQTASRSKLLAAAPHGTRIVFADGDGGLKWVERDGVSVVRAFNINEELASPSPSPSSSTPAPTSALRTEMEGEEAQRDDIVQKIMPTLSPSSRHAHAHTAPLPLGQDSLLIWTGDGRLGRVGFGREGWDEDLWFDAVEELGEEDARRREREREFSGEMRRALEAQAREARWLRGYGL